VSTLVQRRTSNPLVNLLLQVDLVLLVAPLILAAIGVVMVYSATRFTATTVGLSSHYYLDHQAIFVVIGLAVMAIVAMIDYRRYAAWGWIIYGLTLLGLLGVFVVGQGGNAETDGTAVRWYAFGPVQIQPSEFGVLGLVIVIALYCSRHPNIGTKQLLVILGLAGLPMLLVMTQPDLGTTIVMGIVLGTMLVVAGVRLRLLALLVFLVVGGVFLVLHLHLLSPYQQSRINAFIHQGTGNKTINYQKNQSLTAIGSGGMTGRGLFGGPETNLGYVPNQETDFIFTAIGEQLGFVGSAVVLGLFALVALRTVRAIQLAKDAFGRLLCAGALAFLIFSVFQNVGMTIGLMPITGIPLPLISYGGSALFAFFAAIGLVQSVELHRERRR
jgi:rod shape determining protein RodA